MINVGEPIRQGAQPHASRVLGDGPRTIGQSGCLLACLTMVARSLLERPSLDILDAHVTADLADAFSGSGLRVGAAARALGLEHDPEEDRTSFSHHLAMLELQLHRPCILGLDYKPGRSSGFSDADHFVVLVGEDAYGQLLVADPTPGKVITIDPARLRYGVLRRRTVIAEMLLFRRRLV